MIFQRMHLEYIKSIRISHEVHREINVGGIVISDRGPKTLVAAQSLENWLLSVRLRVWLSFHQSDPPCSLG